MDIIYKDPTQDHLRKRIDYLAILFDKLFNDKFTSKPNQQVGSIFKDLQNHLYITSDDQHNKRFTLNISNAYKYVRQNKQHADLSYLCRIQITDNKTGVTNIYTPKKRTKLWPAQQKPQTSQMNISQLLTLILQLLRFFGDGNYMANAFSRYMYVYDKSKRLEASYMCNAKRHSDEAPKIQSKACQLVSHYYHSQKSLKMSAKAIVSLKQGRKFRTFLDIQDGMANIAAMLNTRNYRSHEDSGTSAAVVDTLGLDLYEHLRLSYFSKGMDTPLPTVLYVKSYKPRGTVHSSQILSIIIGLILWGALISRATLHTPLVLMICVMVIGTVFLLSGIIDIYYHKKH